MHFSSMRWRTAAVATGLVALIGLVWWSVASSGNRPRPDADDESPLPTEPAKVPAAPPRLLQPPELPLPTKPAQPTFGTPPTGPIGGGGGGVPPQVGVVPQPLTWEYHVVEFLGRDTDEHAKILNRLAAEGWEYVGLINLYNTQTNGTTNGQPSGLVAFRRPKVQNPQRLLPPLPAPPPPGAEPGQVRPVPTRPVP